MFCTKVNKFLEILQYFYQISENMNKSKNSVFFEEEFKTRPDNH